jgi:hypothetical protein
MVVEVTGIFVSDIQDMNEVRGDTREVSKGSAEI